MGMTPIFWPNDKFEEGAKKVRTMVIMVPRKRAAIPRIMMTVSMGRFFLDIFWNALRACLYALRFISSMTNLFRLRLSSVEALRTKC
jgi:hypothetical protein